MAMDWLWTHPEDGSVAVYTSPSMSRTVGKVEINRTRQALFVWTCPRKGMRILFRNGGLYKNLN